MYNYLKHFMDISRPLPEVPEFENYRQYDPVTKAYDEKTNRPQNYWGSMSKEEFAKKLDAQEDAIKEQYGKNIFDY